MDVGAGLDHTDNQQLKIGIVTVVFTVHSLSVDSIQCPGRILGIISRDLAVYKTNWLRVDTFRFSFIRNNSITLLEITALEILGNIL